MDDTDKSLRECFLIGQQMIEKLITISNGKGELIVGAMAVMLANFESQHKNTISDVVQGANLILMMNEELGKLRGSAPSNEIIN